MTVKRFTVQDEKVLKDNQKYVAENGYVFSYKSDAEEVCNLLNELHEENQLVKDTLNELKSIDGFWDSALLQGYISKIAIILGVDLE